MLACRSKNLLSFHLIKKLNNVSAQIFIISLKDMAVPARQHCTGPRCSGFSEWVIGIILKVFKEPQ